MRFVALGIFALGVFVILYGLVFKALRAVKSPVFGIKSRALRTVYRLHEMLPVELRPNMGELLNTIKLLDARYADETYKMDCHFRWIEGATGGGTWGVLSYFKDRPIYRGSYQEVTKLIQGVYDLHQTVDSRRKLTKSDREMYDQEITASLLGLESHYATETDIERFRREQ